MLEFRIFGFCFGLASKILCDILSYFRSMIMELLIAWVKLYFLLAFIIQEILEVKFQVEVRDKFDAYFLLIFSV